MPRKVRKVPQRTCVGCREVRPKREMSRVVRTPAGEVVMDLSGKQAGRGVYVCPAAACVNRALQRGGLERGLSVTLTEEERAQLARALLEGGAEL